MKKKFRFLSIISIIILCIGFTVREFQNDTFYMIKLGKFITNNRIDLLDHYCWISNLPYTYPHWLYDVFIYNVYNYFGNLGIYISNIFLFILLILVVYYVNLKINKNEFMAFIVSIISIFPLYMFITARAQVVSTILLLLEVYCINKLLDNGKVKYIFSLVFISLLIANIHATIWCVVFIFYLPYFFEYLCFKILKTHIGVKLKIKSSSKKLIIENIKNIKLLFIAFFFSFLVGIFSPSRICYSYVLKIMLGDSQQYIIEHAPSVLIYYPIVMFSICLVLLILIFTKVKIKLSNLLMIFGVFFMFLISSRHFVLFIIIDYLYISMLCTSFFEIENDNTFNILYTIIIKNNIVYLFVLAIVFMVGINKYYLNSKKDFVSNKNYPIDAVNYIKNNFDYKNIKLFNEYNYGSYLLFNDIPVFIDSRCDLYLKEFNGMDYSVFDDSISIEYDYQYDKYFKKYGVDYALVNNDRMLFHLLRLDNNYNIIYKDNYFTIFERVEIYE